MYSCVIKTYLEAFSNLLFWNGFYRAHASPVMPLNCRTTENHFVLSLASRQHLSTSDSVSVCDTNSPFTQHFYFTGFQRQGGKTTLGHQSITHTVFNPRRFEVNFFFFLLKRIDLTTHIAYWPIPPPALMYEMQSLSVFMDFIQLLEVF